MKKGVLFDFDGTLVDTQIHYDTAAAHILGKINAKYTTAYCANYFNGRGWKEVFLELSILEPNEDLHIAFKEALKFAHELTSQAATPNQNASWILGLLEEKNIKKVICSNSSRKAIEHCLNIGNLSHFFKEEEIFSCESVENAKPAPDIYLKAMEYLKLSSNECLVIEDSMAGVISGMESGADVLFYVGATHHRENTVYTESILQNISKMGTKNLRGVIEDLKEINDYI